MARTPVAAVVLGTQCIVGTNSLISATLSLLQDLPPGDVDQELIEDGQWEEILKQPCPSQYSAIKEEDVRSIFTLCPLLVCICSIGKGLHFVCRRGSVWLQRSGS